MHSREALVHRFATDDQFLDYATEGFGEADWLRRPAPGANHAHWILGHLAGARRFLLRGLGETLAVEPWEDRFGMGSRCADGPADPPPAKLREDFRRVGERIRKRLSTITASEAGAPFPGDMPDGAKDREGAAGFLQFHEA